MQRSAKRSRPGDAGLQHLDFEAQPVAEQLVVRRSLGLQVAVPIALAGQQALRQPDLIAPIAAAAADAGNAA